MPYEIEYYAHDNDDRQPAEEFEDALERSAPGLLGKLQGVTLRVAQELPRLVLLGGVVKPTGEPTPETDLKRAARAWADYRETRQVSPPDREEETA